ncbi:MAG: SLC13 family permease [Anaerovoracaceae bacterium]|jgi:sodium-dependent dicarboxylate transporter 2/3/5
MSKSNSIKWIVSFLLPILVSLVPVSESFTAPIKLFMVITIFAICLIATEVVPLFVVSVALPVTYIVFLQIDPKIAFAAWSLDVPWLILGGFILTMALEKTGLLKRVAYRLILLFGGKFNGILFGFMLLGAIISLIITDVAAKAILFGALAVGIAKAFELEMGGRTASALGMAAIASALGPSYLWYTGSNGNIVPFGIMAGAGYEIPSWTEYIVHMFVPQLIYVILTTLIIAVFFKPDVEIKTREYFKSELISFGKMSRDEVKVLVLSILLIIGVVTSSIHKVSIGWLFVYAAIILMLPGMRLVKPENIKDVNFTFILFVVGCLSIGIVSANIGVGQFIADSLYPIIAGSLSRFTGGVWALGFLANLALTPLAAYSAFALPVADMATSLGINPIPVMYAFIHSLEQVIFPYEYAPVLIVFGMGLASAKRYMKFNIMRAALSLICIFVVFIPYWNLIGLL